MRIARAAAALTAAAVILAGCSSAVDDDNVDQTSSAESQDSDTAAEQDATSDESGADDAPQGFADDAEAGEGDRAILPSADMPEAPAASGTTATDGAITITVPSEFTEAEAQSDVQRFEGDEIPESVAGAPSGTEPYTSVIQIYPAQTWEWEGNFHAHPDPQVTQDVYQLDVPGADNAAVEWVFLTEGYEQEHDGETYWNAPHGTGTIQVQVGDQTSRVVIATSPGQAGLDLVASIAASVSVD